MRSAAKVTIRPRTRSRRGAGTRLRQRARLAFGVHFDGEGAGRRIGLDAAVLVAAPWPPGQPVGGRSCAWPAGAVPILALDMYEHSYHMDFGTKAAAYVDAVMANLQWERDHGALPPSATWRSRRRRDVHCVRRTDAGSGGHFRRGVARCHASRTACPGGCLHDRRPRPPHRHARRRHPAEPRHYDRWAETLPRNRPIVAYCIYGFQVSGNAVDELRKRGYDARSLKGGIAAWHAIGGSTVPLDRASYDV